MIKAIANLTQQKNLEVRLRMAKMASIEGIVARIQTLLMTFLFFSLSHPNGVALAQKIETGFDSSFSLSTLQTFDFMKQERQSPDELATDADAENLIRENLASQLSAIGKRKTDTNADFLVAFYAKSVAQTRWRTAGYGGQFGATAETYEVGTLVVDMVSRRDSQVVWRGVATKTLSSKKRNEKAIREACAKLAKQFKKDTEKQMKGK